VKVLVRVSGSLSPPLATFQVQVEGIFGDVRADRGKATQLSVGTRTQTEGKPLSKHSAGTRAQGNMRLLGLQGRGPLAFCLLSLFVFIAPLGAQQLSLQPCDPSYGAEVFTWSGSQPKDKNGKCLGVSAGSSGTAVIAGLCSGLPNQAWLLNADGTMESAAFSGMCWNIWGGAGTVNSSLNLYTCGDAANSPISYFAKQGDGTILAKECGLCVSSVAVPPPPPPPPGPGRRDPAARPGGGGGGGPPPRSPPTAAAPGKVGALPLLWKGKNGACGGQGQEALSL